MFLGFAIMLASGSLPSQGHLGPALWGLLPAMVLVFIGMGLAHFSMPTPLEPITDLPMKHYGWLFVVTVPGMFILRWFNWDGPQIDLLIVIALLVGWWASQMPVARFEAIRAQYRQADTDES